MISRRTINEVKKRLVRIYNPVEIYIFGSYAWGTPDTESDLDLLIIIQDYSKTRHQLLKDGYKGLADLDISKDILVYSKEEFDNFSTDATRFCYKVKSDGQKIYATKA